MVAIGYSGRSDGNWHQIVAVYLNYYNVIPRNYITLKVKSIFVAYLGTKKSLD